MVEFPISSKEISSAWVSRVLGRVVSVLSITQIGMDEGFTGGRLLRVVLNTGSVVVKMSPKDAALRVAFAAANAREVAFYKLSAGWDLPVPAYFYGAFDLKTGASILVIEDMDSRQSIPFSTGCNAGKVVQVVDALAQVHRAFYNTDAKLDIATLTLFDEFEFAPMWSSYPARVAELLPDVVLPDSFLALGDWLANDTRGIFKRMVTGPLTLVHRDVQLDNVLFGEDVVLLDWQFMGRGLGAHDLAFFMISSVAPDIRNLIEGEMISRYYRAINIKDYTLEQCRVDYLFGAVWRLFITVMATTQLDNASMYKQDWRRADLMRLIAFCEDYKIGSDSF